MSPRVLEIGQGSGPLGTLPAAHCGKLLAGFGAEVIKIEPPAGDPLRRVGPFARDENSLDGSLLFNYLNMGKRSCVLDGSEGLRELVSSADVLLLSMSLAERRRLGLTYEQVGQESIIVTAVTPFGDSGPYSDWLDGELVLLALGGLLNMVGAPDREPLKLAGFQAHYAAGLSAFTGIMTALWHRQATGLGQEVEVAMLETVAAIEWKSAAFYQADGKLRQRQGDRGDQWMVVRCADGFAAFVYRDQDWPAVVDLVAGERIADARFASHDGRLGAFDEVRAAVEGWTLRQPKAVVYHAAQARGVPVGMVADMADVLASPQNAASGFLAPVEHPVAGSGVTPQLPFMLDGARPTLGRAPLLGEHTAEVLLLQGEAA